LHWWYEDCSTDQIAVVATNPIPNPFHVVQWHVPRTQGNLHHPQGFHGKTPWFFDIFVPPTNDPQTHLALLPLILASYCSSRSNLMGEVKKMQS
jgi:hypothetical protein